MHSRTAGAGGSCCLPFGPALYLYVPKHFWQVVCLRAQVQVVQDILLHQVQVWVFNQDKPTPAGRQGGDGLGSAHGEGTGRDGAQGSLRLHEGTHSPGVGQGQGTSQLCVVFGPAASLQVTSLTRLLFYL